MTEELVVATKDEALRLQEGIKQLLRVTGASLVEAAIQLDAFKKRRGWEALGYQSMTAWRTVELQASEFYTLRDVTKLLDAGVPSEIVNKMPVTNIQVLTRKLPPSAWKNKQWQQKAIDLPVATFERAATEASADIGMHVEEMQRRGFVLPVSLAEVWDDTLRAIEVLEGVRKMEQKIEMLLSEYLNGPSAMPGRSRLQRYQEIKAGENL